jgi:general secretion pathway protein D
MKHLKFVLWFCLGHMSILHPMLLDHHADMAQIEKEISQASKKRKKSIATKSSELIDFVYQQEPLKELLNHFASKLNINILYPETETITTLVSFNAGKKITMSEAWNFVQMILEQAGYTLIMRDSASYVLVSNIKTYQEPLPLYLGVDYNQLPDTMQRVRFMYFFTNISVTKQQTELQTILSNILPPAEFKNQLQLEPTTNAMILTARADVIKNIMQLITVLDETGFAQAVELYALQHTQAKDIVELFKSILTSSDPTKKAGFVNLSSGIRAKYFSDNVRVENLDPANTRQLNTIILMGKTQDIEEIKKFIKKYLDIPQDKGSSFFHVVDLQWVQAQHLTNLLTNLIQGGASASGQSTSTASSSELTFDPQIKVVSETITQGLAGGASSTTSSSSSDAAQQNTVQRGANRIVVACTPRDWDRIEPLIKQLDIPQKQVIIEALVVDLSLEFIKKLGAQIRTRGITPAIFPKNLQAQAGLLDYNVIQPMNDPDYFSLCGDLSDILNPDFPGSPPALTTPSTSNSIPQPPGGSGAANSGFVGSTVLMLSGGKGSTNGVWAFFQMLSQHLSSKIFTRPVIMVGNNQTGFVESSYTKNLPGTVTQGTNPTVNYQQVSAPIKVKFTPLISDNNVVNLQIDFNLITYTLPDDVTSGTQNIRTLKTNVSLKNGDVLILGGLTKEQTQVSKRSVPFIESIPIIGNFFTSRTKDAVKSQLYMLVRTSVTTPKKGGGMSKITQTASNFIVDQLADVENNFANLKDPITRWFFNTAHYETASEFFEEKITEMPKNDYGLSEMNFKTDHTGHKILNSERDSKSMTVGWFSDQKSESPYASQAVTEDDSSDMDKLSKLLKNIDNPFSAQQRVVL